MSNSFTSEIALQDFSLWDKLRNQRKLISFDLELTARCNNDCGHCYINLPAADKKAKAKELKPAQIEKIAGQAVSLGALWCLITGGEPLLRKDFSEVYLKLKKKGLLVSVFTNATLINKGHVKLFKSYPPRDIEVTVYGVTEATYERVTRKKGLFKSFMRGLNLLLDNGIKVRLKAMALRSNVGELPAIAKFCRARTKDYFRFDPLLHLRFDGNRERNEEIKKERLPAEEIVRIEQADSERSQAMEENCGNFIFEDAGHSGCNHLFHCGAGNGSFSVGYNGLFRLCSSLWHPDCIYDLKNGSLKEAYENFVLRVRDMRSNDPEFLHKCRNCKIINLCIWCPAHSHLETGKMDSCVDYFCRVAHARAEAILKKKAKHG
jgi:radical SAM protein with 4Fe4S-binding SPASM domain